MNLYRSVRLWQLKSGASARELEELVTSGILEMQRWIPGRQGPFAGTPGWGTSRTLSHDYQFYRSRSISTLASN